MNRLEERVAEAFLLTKQAGEEHLVSLDRLPLYQQKGWTKKAADFLSALEAQGLKIVPVEPTEAMLEAGFELMGGGSAFVYAAMLNAVEG
ncbi:MAG: hypothetical protein CL583_13165 [Alteromonadaceae bacterium]|nr:hypothetical protein [Alteromonadaceae bacterium]|tara:strand:+ start:959 stop:1228 length:270 start_codon:yes stop_codon:yes gene_type:complete